MKWWSRTAAGSGVKKVLSSEFLAVLVIAKLLSEAL